MESRLKQEREREKKRIHERKSETEMSSHEEMTIMDNNHLCALTLSV